MIEVQDIPGSKSDEEEDEEDGEEKEEEEEEEEEEALSSHVQGNDEKELSDEAAVAARLEALRLHRALGNDVSDEDADPDSEHSLTDFTSEDDSDDSDDSTGVAQTDFTTYTPSMRNQPRHHTRLPVKEFENRGGARSAIAKQVERERHQTERKVNAGKTSVKLGKQKGHKWKSSDKYVVGKDSGW